MATMAKLSKMSTDSIAKMQQMVEQELSKRDARMKQIAEVRKYLASAMKAFGLAAEEVVEMFTTKRKGRGPGKKTLAAKKVGRKGAAKKTTTKKVAAKKVAAKKTASKRGRKPGAAKKVAKKVAKKAVKSSARSLAMKKAWAKRKAAAAAANP
jgi:hypothetical protein